MSCRVTLAIFSRLIITRLFMFPFVQPEIERWFSIMEERGFPVPEDVPDETFARSRWMKRR
jgi:hypothetical protein